MKVRGKLAGRLVIVPSVEESEKLYFGGFYGTPIGEEKPREGRLSSPIALSLIEALYLAERSVLSVSSRGRELSAEEIHAMLSPRERILYAAYRDLRDAGLVVRSGIKFGADFTVYRLAPGVEHAPYIVHAAEESEKVKPIEIVRAGRVSHSVKKVFSIAIVRADGSVEYLMLRWARL